MAISIRKVVRWVLLVLLIGFLGIQVVRPDRTNPPTNPATSLDALFRPDPEIARILSAACNDCHSHDTRWPWYTNVAPVSWLVAEDVREGRKHVNFSRIGELPQAKQAKVLAEAAEEVSEDAMPLKIYLVTHPDARLSADDRRKLARWFESAAASIKGGGEDDRSRSSGRRGRDSDDDRGR